MAGQELLVGYDAPDLALLRDVHLDGLGHAALAVSRDLNRRHQSAAKIIVFANEKGGVGKSTIAFHCCVALCNMGYRVAAIDLDCRQRTLARALENREGTARRLKVKLPRPQYSTLTHQTGAALAQEISRIGSNADFVILDVAGHDSPIGRHAIAMADTMVTPVNSSFVDIDLLGQFDPLTMELKRFGSFARLVQELREVRDYRKKPPVDWIVVRNRLRRSGSTNEARVGDALTLLSTKAGFRLISSLGERVAYRELFLLGLTLFDLKHIPEFARAQPVAKSEIAQFISELQLTPTTQSKSL